MKSYNNSNIVTNKIDCNIIYIKSFNINNIIYKLHKLKKKYNLLN